jgi:hypothetical protein
VLAGAIVGDAEQLAALATAKLDRHEADSMGVKANDGRMQTLYTQSSH